MQSIRFINRWFKSRTIQLNKNVIVITTGATGSGKTYSNLNIAESWYKERFKAEYPIDNVCFSLGQLMNQIMELQKGNKLRKGELFILEEAGANFGNLDFQNKISKMFSYILQSFRSMNLILLMNAPVLTMINKQARQLIHAHFTTKGIDYGKKVVHIKPLFHQLAQSSGKSYWKYPRSKINGKTAKVEVLEIPKPSDELIAQYEKRKAEFVIGLSKEFIEEYKKRKQEEEIKDARKELTDKQVEVYKMLQEGLSVKQIAEKREISIRGVYDFITCIKKKGFVVPKTLEKQGFDGVVVPKAAF